MIHSRCIGMAMMGIKCFHCTPIGFKRSINCKSIKGIGNRFCCGCKCIKMKRSYVIVIIIGSSRMPTKIIQLSIQKSIDARIRIWIKNRNAIDCDGNRTSREMFLINRNGILRHNRIQRNAPCIGIQITLRYGYLLLPCRDAFHHFMCFCNAD